MMMMPLRPKAVGSLLFYYVLEFLQFYCFILCNYLDLVGWSNLENKGLRLLCCFIEIYFGLYPLFLRLYIFVTESVMCLVYWRGPTFMIKF